MSVREAQEKVDSAEFTQWAGYVRGTPFPIERIELCFALLTSMFYNANRGKNQPSKAPKDFFQVWRKKPAQTEQEMLGILRAFTWANNQAMIAKGKNHGDNRNPQRSPQGNH